MGKSKSPSVNVPKYNEPSPPSYNLFGLQSNYTDGKYSLSEDPQNQTDRMAAEQIRRDLIQSLGLGGGGSEDPFTKLYMQESLRYSQPQLENSLIQRGLGGSSIYQNAIVDLINRASTDAQLTGQNRNLASLQGITGSYLEPYYNRAMQLLANTTNTGLAQKQLAQQQYQALLPYLTTVTMPGNNGISGAINGALTGAQAGSAAGPYGALAGAVVGGAGGYFSSKSGPQTQNYLAYLSSLQNQDKEKSSSSPLGGSSSLTDITKLVGAFKGSGK